jgi:hypothetical protein
MKKICCVLSCVGLILLFNSCGKTDFDSSLVPGKWKTGTYYEKYYDNGTGYSWDESDDVSENEAQTSQTFSWELSKTKLTLIHNMQTGSAKVPKSYTVTELTSSSFKYKDDYGKSYSFTKVN